MRGADPRMLPPSVVPPPDQLAALDRRVRAWAAARPHTVVLPLSEWSALLASDRTVHLGPGDDVPARSLLFVDGLHVNPLGLWWLIDQIDHALERELDVPPEALRAVRDRDGQPR